MRFSNKISPLKGLFALMLCFAFLPFGTWAPASASASEKPYLSDMGQLNYAKFLRAEGEYAKAAREFERVIEQFPASPLIPEAHLRLAETHLDAGDLKEARDQFRQFLENFKESPFAETATLKLFKVEKLLAEAESARAAKEDEEAVKKLPKKRLKPAVSKLLEQPLRAAQVMFFSGRSVEEMVKELAGLKAAGVDTIILRVFHNPGDRYYPFIELAPPRRPSGVYFRTTHAPVVADVLSKVLKEAHKLGLKVFAWMTTRYADYGIADSPGLACKGYDITERKMVRCRGLDVFNEKAVRHLERLYADLASYPIDGILFQDDLILRHNEGFGVYADALFRKEKGAVIDPANLYIRIKGSSYVRYTPGFWEWASWKNKRLLEVAERLKRVVRKRNPGCKFAINMMYESVTNPPSALAWLSQDLEGAKAVGFDYYSIMAYHRQMATELGKGPREVAGLIGGMVEEALTVIGDPRKVLIKLQTIDWDTEEPLPATEVAELIAIVRRVGDVSIAVVPYRPDFPFYELGKGKAGATEKSDPNKLTVTGKKNK